jgi:hypothetical protein
LINTQKKNKACSSGRAGSTLQKQSLLYKTQKKLKANEQKKKYVFLIWLMLLDFDIQGLYGLQIKTTKNCIAKMYSCMCVALYFKKNSETEIGKIASKIGNFFFFFAL